MRYQLLEDEPTISKPESSAQPIASAQGSRFKLLDEAESTTESPSLVSSAIGQIYRPISRAVETTVGLPGALHEGIKWALPAYGEVAEKEQAGPPTPEDIRKHTEKFGTEKLGLSKEQLRAQNPVEEVVDWTVQDLPFIFASGGSGLLYSLGRSAASGVGAIGAKNLGFGGVGQFLGSLLGGASFDIGRKAGTPFGPIRKIAKSKKEALYKQAAEVAPTIKQDATALNNSIEGLLKESNGASSGLTSSQQKEVFHQLENILSRTNFDSINVDEAWKLKKHLYKVIPKLDNDAANYLRRAAGSLEHDVLRPAAEKYPQFGNAYLPANQLHIALDAPNKVRGLIEGNKGFMSYLKNPISKGLIGLFGIGGGYNLGLAKSAKILGGGIASRTALRMYDFYKTPAGRQILSDVLQEALENNKLGFKNALIRLDNAAEEYDKSNED